MHLSEKMIIAIALAVSIGFFVADISWNGFRGRNR